MRTWLARSVRATALLGLGLALGSACDPNVVIGAKRPAEASGGGESGAPAVGQGGLGAQPAAVPLFQADHENGSLSQWDEGSDDDSGGYYGDAVAPSYSTEQAHSGEGSAKLTIDTADGDTIARLYRRIEARDAYYSAWFYLAEDHTPGAWWSIFLFRAVEDRDASVDLWSIDLARSGDDALTLELFDHDANETIEVPGAPLVPIQRWFQLQAHLIQQPGQPSQLTLWLDGVEVLNLTDTTTVPADEPLYWVIGNGGGTMSPSVSTLYVDDARITRSLAGP